MEKSGYYSIDELLRMNINVKGEDVLISRLAKIYSTNFSIGNHVRIDDFCMILGNVELGSNIHIGAYSSLHGTGGGKIILEDYTGLSSYCTIYAAMDDFSGDYLIGPMVPQESQNIIFSNIIMKKYSQMGVRSTLLAGAIMEEGTVLMGHGLLYDKTKAWTIYGGCPAKPKKERKDGLLKWI